jgi:hypothetical protein
VKARSFTYQKGLGEFLDEFNKHEGLTKAVEAILAKSLDSIKGDIKTDFGLSGFRLVGLAAVHPQCGVLLFHIHDSRGRVADANDGIAVKARYALKGSGAALTEQAHNRRPDAGYGTHFHRSSMITDYPLSRRLWPVPHSPA